MAYRSSSLVVATAAAHAVNACTRETNMTARTTALAALACLTLSLGVTPAQTQTFPSKPVRIVVAYPAGGSVDNISRAVTPRLLSLIHI